MCNLSWNYRLSSKRGWVYAMRLFLPFLKVDHESHNLFSFRKRLSLHFGPFFPRFFKFGRGRSPMTGRRTAISIPLFAGFFSKVVGKPIPFLCLPTAPRLFLDTASRVKRICPPRSSAPYGPITLLQSRWLPPFFSDFFSSASPVKYPVRQPQTYPAEITRGAFFNWEIIF